MDATVFLAADIVGGLDGSGRVQGQTRQVTYVSWFDSTPREGRVVRYIIRYLRLLRWTSCFVVTGEVRNPRMRHTSSLQVWIAQADCLGSVNATRFVMSWWLYRSCTTTNHFTSPDADLQA